MSISVVMSAYNAEKFLPKAIESILSQTFDDLEFIIVNDSSSDNTLAIIQDYSKQDSRIVVINNPENIGLTRSLNIALEHAGGKYIARMDADDVSHKDRLARQYEYLENNPDVTVLGTCGLNIDENGIVLGKRSVPLTHDEILKVINLANPMIHSSVMFRKKDIEKIRNYNPKYRVVQDYDLWFRCLENGYRLANLPDQLLYYRVGDDYHKRKSLKYRITDFNVRREGFKRIKLPVYRRYGLIVPLVLAFFPNSFYKKAYRLLEKIDPR